MENAAGDTIPEWGEDCETYKLSGMNEFQVELLRQIQERYSYVDADQCIDLWLNGDPKSIELINHVGLMDCVFPLGSVTLMSETSEIEGTRGEFGNLIVWSCKDCHYVEVIGGSDLVKIFHGIDHNLE